MIKSNSADDVLAREAKSSAEAGWIDHKSETTARSLSRLPEERERERERETVVKLVEPVSPEVERRIEMSCLDRGTSATSHSTAGAGQKHSEARKRTLRRSRLVSPEIEEDANRKRRNRSSPVVVALIRNGMGRERQRRQGGTVAGRLHGDRKSGKERRGAVGKIM
ncbi:hypothetical protein JCGZ_24185 [Jatropha curcas]|uniref:Uncharacterized protein n=1 Tax=Jatropha curcas TaxID=180498 RepID=A0A067JMP8_JATCU|nr:hypothetical protein JCGZ_24185 [Jatropha curcas]